MPAMDRRPPLEAYRKQTVLFGRNCLVWYSLDDFCELVNSPRRSCAASP